MEKVYLLKENEVKEIGIFLGMFLTRIKKDKVRGIEPDVNIPLLERYKKELWGN
jgi:hypothetical protein